MSELALFGGPKTVVNVDTTLYQWPIVNEEMEQAVLDVLHKGTMSKVNITKEFESKFAQWMGVAYGLASPNGTASLQEAMFAVGIGPGTELICSPLTYWASCLQAVSLGARVVFADVEPDTLCLDPASFEAHITPRTKAVVVVHYMAHPADMDPIMDVARRHGIKVIEDVSHAQGGIYKGRKLGTIGDVAACSLMSEKSFAIGEGGMLYTNDRDIYNRAVAYGHYERITQLEGYAEIPGSCHLPLGGCKHRLNQMAAAIGLCQLKKYESEIAEINRAMTFFTEAISEIPGISNHFPYKWHDSTKAGWYSPKVFYDADAFEGLSADRFAEAVRAEGIVEVYPGCNCPLHTSTLFTTADIFGIGKPTACTYDDTPAPSQWGTLPVAEAANDRVLQIPLFKHFNRDIITPYIQAFRKVAENYKELLEGDEHRKTRGLFHFAKLN